MVAYDGNELEYPKEESDEDRERAAEQPQPTWQEQQAIDDRKRREARQELDRHRDMIRDRAGGVLEHCLLTHADTEARRHDQVLAAAALWLGRKLDDNDPARYTI